MIQFDDSVTAANLPAGQTHGVYYVDGIYANEAEVRARLPHATLAGVTAIAPGKTGTAIAFCDCERFDLTPAQAIAWVAKQIALGVELVGVYASLATWAGGLYDALAHYGRRIKRWCAAYDQNPALTLTYQGKPYSFDAHQWAGGLHAPVDKNVAAPDFFVPYKPAKPRGTARFSGSVDFGTGEWTIEGLPGHVEFGSAAAYWSAEIQVGAGGKDAGHWRIKSMPKNAKPLGGA